MERNSENWDTNGGDGPVDLAGLAVGDLTVIKAELESFVTKWLSRNEDTMVCVGGAYDDNTRTRCPYGLNKVYLYRF